jgi:hypothetical protein
MKKVSNWFIIIILNLKRQQYSRGNCYNCITAGHILIFQQILYNFSFSSTVPRHRQIIMPFGMFCVLLDFVYRLPTAVQIQWLCTVSVERFANILIGESIQYLMIFFFRIGKLITLVNRNSRNKDFFKIRSDFWSYILTNVRNQSQITRWSIASFWSL